MTEPRPAVDYTGLTVADPDRVIGLFADVLGFALASRRGRRAVYLRDDDGLTVELMEDPAVTHDERRTAGAGGAGPR